MHITSCHCHPNGLMSVNFSGNDVLSLSITLCENIIYRAQNNSYTDDVTPPPGPTQTLAGNSHSEVSTLLTGQNPPSVTLRGRDGRGSLTGSIKYLNSCQSCSTWFSHNYSNQCKMTTLLFHFLNKQPKKKKRKADPPKNQLHILHDPHFSKHQLAQISQFIHFRILLKKQKPCVKISTLQKHKSQERWEAPNFECYHLAKQLKY